MNPGFTYQINVGIIGDSPLNRLLASLDKINRTLDIIERNTHQTSNAITNMANRGSAAVSGLGSSFGNLIGTVGAVSLATKSMHDAMAMQGASRAIDFASGNAAEGAKNMAFLKTTIEDMGLPMKESMEGFKVLDASIYGTGLSQQFARDMFENTAMATTVLGVSADKTQNAFLALGQMASKGTVSMEELKGQLGDALPGAAAVAARAMGMTIPTFNKMVEDGKLLAKDFLPKFSAELKNTFQDALPGAVNSAQANFNRFNTSIAELSITFGERLLPPVVSFMQDYLIPAAHWIGTHLDLMEKWAFGIGSVVLGLKAYNTIAAIAAWRTAMLGTKFAGLGKLTLAQSIANIGLTSSIWSMTIAMLENPVTWITVGIVALGGAIWYAYNNSKEFRATLSGVWEVLKYVGNELMYFGKWLWNAYTRASPLILLLTKFGDVADYISSRFLKLLRLFTWVGDAISDMTGMTTAFNKGWDTTMMVEKFGETIPVINDTTKAVLGLTDAYALMNKQTVGTSENMQSHQQWMKAHDMGYKNKVPLMLKTFAKVDATKDSGKPDDKLQNGINNITGGGRQTRIITFNNVKVGERIDIHTINMKEGAGEAGEMVRRELLQLLNSANQVQ